MRFVLDEHLLFCQNTWRLRKHKSKQVYRQGQGRMLNNSLKFRDTHVTMYVLGLHREGSTMHTALTTRRTTLLIAAALLLTLGISMLIIGWAIIAPSQQIVIHDPATPTPATSWLTTENAKQGSTGWMPLTAKPLPGDTISGYAGATSVTPGGQLPLYISLSKNGTYDLDVYRIGWYGGTGGHLYLAKHTLPGLNQGDYAQHHFIGCTTCVTASVTHRVEAHWKVSYTLSVPADWPTGVYLAKLTVDPHTFTYIIFVVRDDNAHAIFLADLPFNTYQAYNQWGGYSLYAHDDPKLNSQAAFKQRAFEVSYDRPLQGGFGTGDFLRWDIETVRWIERNNFDVAYTTNVDLTAHPEQILNHRIYLALGHDEYWTKAMRDGIEQARNAGVSLAFLGANDSFWQARLAPDSGGIPNHTLVCYKVWTDLNPGYPTIPATLDPLYKTQPALVTARWRDSVLHRPENALLGLMYIGDFDSNMLANGHHGIYLPDWVVNSSLPPIAKGTNLVPGEHISGGILGYEMDGVVNNGQTPADLKIIANSPVYSFKSLVWAKTSYYYAPSGAMVFDAGSMWWAFGLDNGVGGHLIKHQEQIQSLMANIIAAMEQASPGKPQSAALLSLLPLSPYSPIKPLDYTADLTVNPPKQHG